MERTPDDSLRRIIRVLKEEAALLGAAAPDLAAALLAMTDHLVRATAR